MRGELFVGIKKERYFWDSFYGGIKRSGGYIYKFKKKKAVGWFYKRKNMLNYRVFYLLKFRKLFVKCKKMYWYKRLKFTSKFIKKKKGRKKKRKRRRRIFRIFNYFLAYQFLKRKYKYKKRSSFKFRRLKREYKRKYKKKFKLKYKIKGRFLYLRLFKFSGIDKNLNKRLKKRYLRFWNRKSRLWRRSFWLKKRVKTGLWAEWKVTNKKYFSKCIYLKNRKKNKQLRRELKKPKVVGKIKKKWSRLIERRNKRVLERDKLLLELNELLLEKKELLTKENLLLEEKDGKLLLKKKALKKVKLILKIEEILKKKYSIVSKKTKELITKQEVFKTIANRIKKGSLRVWCKLLIKLRGMRLKRLLLKRKVKLKRELKYKYKAYVNKFYRAKNIKLFICYYKIVKKLKLKKNLKLKLVKGRIRFYKKKRRFKKFRSGLKERNTLIKRGHKYSFVSIRNEVSRKYNYLPFNKIVKIAIKEFQYYSRIGVVRKHDVKLKAKLKTKYKLNYKILDFKLNRIKKMLLLEQRIKKKIKYRQKLQKIKVKGKSKKRVKRKIKFEIKLAKNLKPITLIKVIKQKKQKKIVNIVENVAAKRIAINVKELVYEKKKKIKRVKKEEEEGKKKRVLENRIFKDKKMEKYIKKFEGLKRSNLKEVKDLEFSSSWFYKLFSGCFAKKGNRTRAEYMFGRVLRGVKLKLKSKRFEELKWVIYRKFTKMRPLTGIRLKIIAGITHRFPRRATLKSEYAIILHWFVSSILKRKEYNLDKKLINEFVDLFKYKGGTIRKRFEFNWTILDTRPYTSFLRSIKKRKRRKKT